MHQLWEGPFDLDLDLDDDNDLNEFLSGELWFIMAEEHAHSPCLLFGWVADGGWCAGGMCVWRVCVILRAVNSGGDATATKSD